MTVDNLRVPQGASCKLYGTRVKGTIKVEYRALLRAEGVIVIGDVQYAENSAPAGLAEHAGTVRGFGYLLDRPDAEPDAEARSAGVGAGPTRLTSRIASVPSATPGTIS